MIPPLALTALRAAAPYAVAAGVGFSVAWWLQGLRLDAAENATQKVQNDFDWYKTEQQRLKNDADRLAEKRRKEAEDEWNKRYAQLQADGEAFRRCVAAGKCGGLRQPVPACPAGSGIRVPPAVRPDEAGTNAVPLAGEPATPPVINDCAVTTLMLNQLQSDIEKQLIK